MNPEDLINSAREDIKHAAEYAEPATNPEDNAKDVEKKRDELLVLAGDGEIKKSEAYVRKANAKTILKLYAEYEASVQERSTIFLCDMFLSKFAMMMGGLDAVEKPEVLEKELKRDPYLNRDLKSFMSRLTPMIPFLGLLSGGLTVGKHVYNHKHSEVSDEHMEVKTRDYLKNNIINEKFK